MNTRNGRRKPTKLWLLAAMSAILTIPGAISLASSAPASAGGHKGGYDCPSSLEVAALTGGGSDCPPTSVAPTGAGSAIALCDGKIWWEYTVSDMGTYPAGWLYVAATGVPPSNPFIFSEPSTYVDEFSGMDTSVSNTVGFGLVYDQETGAMISNDVIVPPAEGCDEDEDPTVGINIQLDDCEVVGTISQTGISGQAGYGYRLGTANPPTGGIIWLGNTDLGWMVFSLDGLAPGTYYVQGFVSEATGAVWESDVASVVVPQSCDTTPPVTPPTTPPVIPPIIPPTTEPPTEPSVPPAPPTEPTVPTEPTTPVDPTSPTQPAPPTTPAPTGTVPVAPNTDGAGASTTPAWLLLISGLVLGGGLIARRKLS